MYIFLIMKKQNIVNLIRYNVEFILS